MTSKAQATEENIDKLDMVKILKIQKTPSRKWKDNPWNGRKVLQIMYPIRDYYLDYKELL